MVKERQREEPEVSWHFLGPEPGFCRMVNRGRSMRWGWLCQQGHVRQGFIGHGKDLGCAMKRFVVTETKLSYMKIHWRVSLVDSIGIEGAGCHELTEDSAAIIENIDFLLVD